MAVGNIPWTSLTELRCPFHLIFILMTTPNGIMSIQVRKQSFCIIYAEIRNLNTLFCINYAPGSGSRVAAGTGPRVVLYGVIGSSSLCESHSYLLTAAKTGKVRLSLRHSFHGLQPLPDQLVHTQLKGFGVVLDVKNMEYKNVDDRSTTPRQEGGDDSAQSTEDGDDDVSDDVSGDSGFVFTEGEQVS
jgi:hypothetical protein